MSVIGTFGRLWESMREVEHVLTTYGCSCTINGVKFVKFHQKNDQSTKNDRFGSCFFACDSQIDPTTRSNMQYSDVCCQNSTTTTTTTTTTTPSVGLTKQQLLKHRQKSVKYACIERMLDVIERLSAPAFDKQWLMTIRLGKSSP